MYVASAAVGVIAPRGARESPEEGDGILQTGRSPRLRQDPTSQAGYPCPIPQQGKAESAADETRKALSVSGCPPKWLGTCITVGLPPAAGLENQLGQAHLAGTTFLVAFPVASPHRDLGFWVNWGRRVGNCSRSMCVSRGCPAARAAPDKLVGTMEMDTRVKIQEAGLADEAPGMAALGGHLPGGLACASFLLLGCRCARPPPW